MELTKLTKKQEQLMLKVRDDWLNKLFRPSSIDIDRKTVDESIKWLYKLSKLKEPKIIYLSSPLGAQIAANKLRQVVDRIRDIVRDQVWSQVGNQVWNQVWNQVGNQVGDRIRDIVRDQVWSQVGEQVERQVGNQVRGQVERQVGREVRDQVERQVWSQVGEQVERQVGRKVRDQVGREVREQVERQVGREVRDQVWSQKLKYFSFSGYGNIWDYGWVAFYDFFGKLKLVKNPELNNFVKLLDTGIYDMIQLDGLCIVCEKPVMILRNEQNRLHSTSRPAIEWRDGFKLWYIHGVAFEYDEWNNAVTQKLSIREVLNISNIEKRYAVLSVYVPEKVIEQADSVKVSEGKKGITLFSSDKIISGKIVKFLRYTCPSTNRVYISFVPSEMNDATEAMAWKFTLEKKEYERLTKEA